MANTGLDVFVLDAAANALAGLSGVIFAPMSFLVYFGLSFLIPSTSGMATVSMPIMGPLAVKLGFSPEVMVMIFSAAIGVVNLFTPTSGAIMGGLALAKIEWTTWLKFALSSSSPLRRLRRHPDRRLRAALSTQRVPHGNLDDPVKDHLVIVCPVGSTPGRLHL
ncbi:MAG: hypothetical protein ACLU37_05550 [Collinsella sp.]